MWRTKESTPRILDHEHESVCTVALSWYSLPRHQSCETFHLFAADPSLNIACAGITCTGIPLGRSSFIDTSLSWDQGKDW